MRHYSYKPQSDWGTSVTTTFDPNVPHVARVLDYLQGGTANFESDRQVAEYAFAAWPGGDVRVDVRAARAALVRIVKFLTAEAGIRQFLDIGTGIPTADNVHEVAQALAPETHVLYVDNDPMVLTHARALMKSSPEGRTAFVQADIRRPADILQHPVLVSVLDSSRPVALLLIGIVHHLRDADAPVDVVRTLVEWLPSGSYLALVTPSADFDPQMMRSLAVTAERSGIPYIPRSKSETERFFTGLELVAPGVAPILGWRPDDEPADVNAVHGWAGLARKA